MKKGNINFMVLLIVVIAGVVVGLNINETSLTSVLNENINVEKTVKHVDPYEPLRSDNKYPNQEELIKNAFDEYMSFNFYQLYKTTWFDSVAATGAAINRHGTVFMIQSKGNEYDKQAEEFLGAAAFFFNDKTLDQAYKVDRLVLVNKDFDIIKEIEIIKW